MQLILTYEFAERFPDDEECQISEREADPLPLSPELDREIEHWIEESFH
jgi:hypothetical protein